MRRSKLQHSQGINVGDYVEMEYQTGFYQITAIISNECSISFGDDGIHYYTTPKIDGQYVHRKYIKRVLSPHEAIYESL